MNESARQLVASDTFLTVDLDSLYCTRYCTDVQFKGTSTPIKPHTKCMTGSTMQNVWCGTRTDHSPYNMYGGQPAEIFFLDTSYSPIKRLAEMTE